MVILTHSLVLSVFSPTKPLSSLEVHQELERVTGQKIEQGRVNPKLRSLEGEGLLHSWDEDSDNERVQARGGGPYRMYQLTASGLRHKTHAEDQTDLGPGFVPESS